MSRTIQTIYNEIITEKQTFTSLNSLVPNPDTAQTFLADLTSTSKVAIWRLLCWLMAFLVWTHEQIFDQHVIEIEARAQEIIPGTTRWYKNIALLFQNGYALTWDGDKYIYTDTTSLLAEASKVVTQSACIEVNTQVLLKIAGGTLGAFAPITAAQLLAFTSYIQTRKFAGVNVTIINWPHDLLKIQYTIEYDPLVIGATGLLLADGTTYPVVEAINDYIQALPFNATLKMSALTDAIQAVNGVMTSVCEVAEAKTNGAAIYTDILATTTDSYVAYSGYLLIDPAFPLSSQITYIPG
jgi:hypothetical protein